MQSFLTGSRAYGSPRPDSDVDICVYVDPADESLVDLNALKQLCGGSFTQIGLLRYSGRCGPINFIICADEDDFRSWQEVTELLTKIAPVSRDYAIEQFNKVGLTGMWSNRGDDPLTELRQKAAQQNPEKSDDFELDWV